jgi:hypothetical protein
MKYKSQMIVVSMCTKIILIVLRLFAQGGSMTEPWVKTYSGGKPNYTEPCERCGEVNPAEIHTCTPMAEKDIQTSDNNNEEKNRL